MTFASVPLAGHTVIVIHAHPDDEAIFTGITIRRLADAGARVVLVTGTLGELGAAGRGVARGQTLAERRIGELEEAAELLGVQRLVLLGYRDSGLPGAPDNTHPHALAAADPHRVAARVIRLVDEENAHAVVHDDPRGIYGHPDHRAVHRIGAAAAAARDIPAYQSTVDREHLQDPRCRTHLLHAASRASGQPFGVPAANVALTITATAAELHAKHAAIGAHASQVAPAAIAWAAFEATYGCEWFLRSGRPGVLDRLGRSTASAPAVVG